MYNTSMYECIGIKAFSENNTPYSGKGPVKYVEIILSNKRVTRPVQTKTIDLVVNTHGLTNAERKIKNKLRHEGVLVPANLRGLMLSHTEDKKH